jgi:hypothetical protein
VSVLGNPSDTPEGNEEVLSPPDRRKKGGSFSKANNREDKQVVEWQRILRSWSFDVWSYEEDAELIPMTIGIHRDDP